MSLAGHYIKEAFQESLIKCFSDFLDGFSVTCSNLVKLYFYYKVNVLSEYFINWCMFY